VDAKAASDAPLAGGHLLSAISTSIVGILREHYGRGPMKAKTYVLDDIIVVVMRGSGFTPLEQTIMNSGQPDRVIAMSEDFQPRQRWPSPESCGLLANRPSKDAGSSDLQAR
jgi:hypothetical protein